MKIKIFKIVFISIILVVACNKKLEIAPYTSISIESAKEQTEILLAGMYAFIGGGSSTQNGAALGDNGALYGNDLILIPDLLGSQDYLTWLGTFGTYREISEQQIGAENSVVFRVWRKAYKAINLANIILESLPADGGDGYKGQALFIRGIMHFELLRLYGEGSLGVPLKLTATDDFSQVVKIPRSSKTDVYNQVLSDLIEAESLLSTDETFYASKAAATAFLAKVYLEMGDYSNALASSNQIISDGLYAVSSNVTSAYNGGASESIFEIQQTVLNNSGTANDGLTTFYGCAPDEIPASTGRGDIKIDSAFILKYEVDDSRLSDLIYLGNCTRENVTSGKWKDPYTNIPVVRISEMYLIRAESNFRLGSTDGSAPLDDINFIRSNRNASILGTVTLDDIFNERDLELAFEGQKIYDLRRKDPTTYAGGKYVLPIPQQEINTSGIEQNSYYK